VGSFLEATDLAAAEQAGIFHQICTGTLWETLARNASEAVVPWDGPLETLVPLASKAFKDRCTPAPSGKVCLREMWKLCGCFVPPCPCCSPGVTALSPCCLQAVPRSAAPWHSRVALQLGARLGNPLAIGFRMTCKGGQMNEGCCCGLELMGSCSCHLSYTFAPTSGRCFQECHMGNRALSAWAQALPGLCSCDCVCGAEHEKVVDVWVKVTPEGDVVFLRQVQGGPVETTGVLPHKALPDFVSEYHAAVHFWSSHLEVPVSTSVIHSGRDLPRNLQACEEMMREFSAQWYLELSEDHMAHAQEVRAEEHRPQDA